MNCPNCQREIPDKIKFCPRCGQPVQIIKPQKKSAKIILALILVLVIATSLFVYRICTAPKTEEDPAIEYKFLNGLTYCTDGIIYVDTDLSDDQDPYVLGKEDEDLVDACAFSYLSTFSPDTSSIYYISDLKKNKTEISGTLYRINIEDITDDIDENIKKSELVAEDVIEFFVSSGLDNGVMYQNIEEEMCFYSDYGNEYLMDGSDIAYAYCIYNHESSHIILTMKKERVSNSSGIYIGAGYDMYHYDSATNEFVLIDYDISFPTGKYNKIVYNKHDNRNEKSLDAYIADITDEGIKTTKIDEDVTGIYEACITDEITHITYSKEGDHPDDYTYYLFSYDNGIITELGEVGQTRMTTEYVTFFDNYEPTDETKDYTQYYNTGSSEIYKSPFTSVIDVEMALDSGKILVQAYNEKSVSCVYLCDVEYGKEITNIQMVGYNSCISGSYGQRYLFYSAGEKTRNLYLQGDDNYKLMIRDIMPDAVPYLKITPTIDDKSYQFIVNLLDYDDNSSIYDLYIKTDDKTLKRIETIVENILITGKGAVFTKDKVLYYYDGKTDETEKIADSTYYFEAGNKYEGSISLNTYIY